MNNVKITVLKTMFNEDLAKEYGVEGLSTCPMLQEGQVFYTDYAKPDGFCDEAWKAIYQYVFALSHGAENELFYYGDWIKIPGVAICSCNDGLRPVIFKLESINKQSVIEEVDECDSDEEITEEDEDNGNDFSCTLGTEGDIAADDHTEKQVNEELIVSIYKDTKSVDLLDQFEGYSSSDKQPYKRIVVRNGVVICPFRNIYYHYVIERSSNVDYVGDITFTEFKKGHVMSLQDHIRSELNDDIISQYKDSNSYYKFSKPYRLRAQNSHNRTGYGWDWDWSGGYGSYIEGTFYGETTNYLFTGVYITTGYAYPSND